MIEVESIGSDVYILIARGHHDVHEFMKQVRDDGYSWPLGMPKHIWMKTVPTRDPGYTCKYVVADKSVRGAWPATHVQEAWGADSYEAKAAQPPYPSGDIVGPCVCGSWPGGNCLKCPWIPAQAAPAAASTKESAS